MLSELALLMLCSSLENETERRVLLINFFIFLTSQNIYNQLEIRIDRGSEPLIEAFSVQLFET